MKILVDNKIPFLDEAIKELQAEIVFLSAKEFTSQTVKDADILIVRTRTKCNASLLEGSKVKFIATATIGFDHIDIAYCASHGILWQNAPGCNSNSVRQYIQSALILLKQNYLFSLEGKTLAVIGVGHVGCKIVDLGRSYGMKVLMNDPLRAEKEADFQHTSLDIIACQADIISFHVPLVRQGNYPTYHLANEAFFNQLKKTPILINTSRGEVIDGAILKDSLARHTIKQAIIDVWENEPHIDAELLEKVFLGTPHIAGYSADGKAKASEMALQAVSDFLNLGLKININLPQPLNPILDADSMDSAYLEIYNPEYDSLSLKEHIQDFEALRSNYSLRRESLAYTIRVEQ
ncbi:4-phosphoerythronate dehydrogenase [Bacteroides propionicifaciens]|uniref:4-phosphoerythronate dehydrogenase n=1 Tax=Bacteroides propionicifaciens TaxID=392838 RepID=UPI00036FD0FC|nr:4-phosphoerythronate dehydrogenase [Bacteroides propionicifaciens]